MRRRVSETRDGRAALGGLCHQRIGLHRMRFSADTAPSKSLEGLSPDPSPLSYHPEHTRELNAISVVLLHLLFWLGLLAERHPQTDLSKDYLLRKVGFAHVSCTTGGTA